MSFTQSAITRDALRITGNQRVLQQQYQRLRDEVQLPYVHQDDTGRRVHGKQAWLQAFETQSSGAYQIRLRHTHADVQELTPNDYQAPCAVTVSPDTTTPALQG